MHQYLHGGVREGFKGRLFGAGVSLGAVLGHALATLLAVTGGALASKYISERALGFAGGSLFLIFAALTLFGVF